MLRMKFQDVGVIVVEPGNLTKLQTGVHFVFNVVDWSDCREVLLYYCPDIVRLSVEIGNLDHRMSLDELQKMLAGALEWRIYDRVAS